MDNYSILSLPNTIYSKKASKIIHISNSKFDQKTYVYYYFINKCLILKNLKIFFYLNKVFHEFYNLELESGKVNIFFIKDKIKYKYYKCIYYILLKKNQLIKQKKNKYDLKKIFFINKKIKFKISSQTSFIGKHWFQNYNLNKKKIISIYAPSDHYNSRLRNRHNNYKNKITHNQNNLTSAIYKDVIKFYKNEYFFIKLGQKDQDLTLDKYKFENYLDLSNSKDYCSQLELFILYNSFGTVQSKGDTADLARILNVPLLVLNDSNQIMQRSFDKKKISLIQKIYIYNEQFLIDNFKKDEIIKKSSSENILYGFKFFLDKFNKNFKKNKINEIVKKKVSKSLNNNQTKEKLALKNKINEIVKKKVSKSLNNNQTKEKLALKNKIIEIKTKEKIKGSEACFCGSGKKFKRCHGAKVNKHKSPEKIKENEACFCGSGEKYKRCHGATISN